MVKQIIHNERERKATALPGDEEEEEPPPNSPRLTRRRARYLREHASPSHSHVCFSIHYLSIYLSISLFSDLYLCNDTLIYLSTQFSIHSFIYSIYLSIHSFNQSIYLFYISIYS